MDDMDGVRKKWIWGLIYEDLYGHMSHIRSIMIMHGENMGIWRNLGEIWEFDGHAVNRCDGSWKQQLDRACVMFRDELWEQHEGER